MLLLGKSIRSISISSSSSRGCVVHLLKRWHSPSHSKTEEEAEKEKEKEKKSKAQKKRDASKAVDWGKQLVSLTPPQLQQVILWNGLSEEVFEAIMLAKKFGPEVRNGRRRQFNFIGGLLRGVDADLMKNAIKASKDGNVEGIFPESAEAPVPIDEIYVSSGEEEDEEKGHLEAISQRWLDGLVSGDQTVADEVYSLHSVDFDWQELQRLIREIHISEAHKESTPGSNKLVTDSEPDSEPAMLSEYLDGKASKARNDLSKFLFELAIIASSQEEWKYISNNSASQ